MATRRPRLDMALFDLYIRYYILYYILYLLLFAHGPIRHALRVAGRIYN
jgi:hypothetical protein